MKNFIKLFLALISFTFYSCSGTHDDTALTAYCNGNCNVITGRIYKEDNTGIGGVGVLFFYKASGIGYNYTRVIARTVSDADGNYTIEGFVKDNEFNSGNFFMTVDTQKIESALTDDFFKPSDLVSEFPAVNAYMFPYIHNRSAIHNIDYKIPFKNTQIVNLTDFNPVTANDYFAIGNYISYGFPNDFSTFLAKQSGNGYSYADGINTTVNLAAVFGSNKLVVSRRKNNEQLVIFETVTIDNPNPNVPLTYPY